MTPLSRRKSTTNRRARARQLVRPTTVAQQAKFLAEYAKSGVITTAAKAAGIDRKYHYDWLEDADKYPEYEAQFKDAHERACDRLEREATRRAVEGWDEPVYQRGEKVGTVRRYSDRLLEIMLKARRPERFRERSSVSHENPDGSKMESVILVLPSNGREVPVVEEGE